MIKIEKEIEFRGRDEITKKWYYGGYAYTIIDSGEIPFVCIGQIRRHHIIISEGNYYYVDGDTISQYIGEKDNESTKIYSGDILKNVYGQTDNCYVNWNNDTLSYELIDTDGCIVGDFGDYSGDDFLVIGNIWDKPELMSDNNG